MDKSPFFTSLKELDRCVEREIAKYLDVHFYPLFFDDFRRINDAVEQKKGKDMIASSVKLALSNAIIDEKSASHYVNENLPTFAFEISYLGNGGKVVDGWFVDDDKLTEYYLLIWPQAKPDKIQYFKFKGKEYPYFRYEDITELYYVLASRDSIRQYVEEHEYNKEWLGITAKMIRKEGPEWLKKFNAKYKRKRIVYFFYTLNLKEEPINLIIPRECLESIAILKGKC